MNTRRQFLESIGLGAAAAAAAAAPQVPAEVSGRNRTEPQYAPEPPQAVPELVMADQLQVPKVNFGQTQVSRLVVGCNPFYGFAHFNSTLSGVMKEWYTPDRVCGVLHQCTRFGINAYNYVHVGRSPADWARFLSEGGSMHLIVQGMAEPELVANALKPLAIYHNGELTDRAFREGKRETVRQYCKRLRQLGVLVGIGTHQPEVIAAVEEEGWDVDFYAGCVYNRTRTPDQIRKLLNGELPLGELYLEDDPPRMYNVMRQTSKTCFAFKILAAGRIERPQAVAGAYRMAFESLKPQDCVFVGMFPKLKDEVRHNAECVSRALHGA